MFQFLSLQPQILALDISERSIKFLDVEKKGKKIKKIQAEDIETSKRIVENGLISQKKEVLDILKSIRDRTNKKYISLALPEEKSFIQIIKIPKVSSEKIEELVYYEAENYIPLSVQDVYLDFQLIEPLKDHLNYHIVLLAAVPRKIVDSYNEVIKEAGFQAFAFETEALAISRAIIPDQISYYPVLLIDMGRSRTQFIIYSGRSVRFSSSINVSSEDFTKKIAKVFNLSLKKAEEKKIKHGIKPQKIVHLSGGHNHLKKQEISSQIIFESVRDLLEELKEEIQSHLDYYYSHDFSEHLPAKDRKIKKIIISGGGAYLKGLPEFLENSFKIKVERGNPWINFSSSDRKIFENYFQEKSLSFTTAAGLLLRDFYKEFYD